VGDKKHSRLDKRVVKILLIGPLPPPFGGTRISFQYLTGYLLGCSGIKHDVVDLRPFRKNIIGGLVGYLVNLYQILVKINNVDVITLHCNSSALVIFGMPILLCSKFYKKPYVVRTFGGDLILQDYGWLKKYVIRLVLSSSDLYLAQTLYQVKKINEAGLNNVRWFPTSRPYHRNDLIKVKETCKRLIYCGHIKPSKGIREIISAGDLIPEDVVIDLYGVLQDGMRISDFDSHAVNYKGELMPKDVLSTIKNYDAMIMPTYFHGEGYPGSILEAYSVGLPVIATRWRSIPEIVDDSSGILIEPKSIQSLKNAIMKLTSDKDLYIKLQDGAREKANYYSLDMWGNQFISYCRCILDGSDFPLDPIMRD